MSAGSDFARVRELFERLRDLDPQGREAQLAAEPANVAADVRELLLEAADVGTFLEPGLEPGAEIGGFRILRRIGHGGMGVVYEAEQSAPRRRVALKTVRPGSLGPDGLRRFQREAEVMARLDHPAIAEVYASGVERRTLGGLAVELPWYAMRMLPDALPITLYAERHGLNRAERLTLFRRALHGVQAAHEGGVIHRDLKAENVLVDRDGALAVIDFGIARAEPRPLDLSTLETATGRLLGTVRSMSPEQLEGRREALGPESDIYALGVLLYELLLGRPPHLVEGLALPEVARRVREEQPLRPSRADPSVRGDLETILLTSVETDPHRRYRSAAAFAEDLDRWSASQPIRAKAPSLTYRLERFSRRHRSWLAVAAGGLLLLVAGTWWVRGAERAEAAAEASAQATALLGLERNAELTGDLGRRLHQMAGGAGVRRDLLRSSIEELRALLDEHEHLPGLRLQLARSELLLGDVLGAPSVANLGDTVGAWECYDLAETHLAALPVDEPAAARTRALLQRRRAALAFSEGDLDEALVQARSAHEDALRFAHLAPQVPEADLDLAFVHDVLATVHGARGELSEQAEQLDHGVQAIERYLAAGGDPEPGETKLAYLRLTRGAMEWSRGDYAAARDENERAARLFEELAQRSPTLASLRFALGRARFWEGSAAAQLDDLQRAERCLTEAAERFQALLAGDPQNPQPATFLANAYHMLGGLEVGRADKAVDSEVRREHLERAYVWRARCVDFAEGSQPCAQWLPTFRQALDDVENQLSGP